MTYDEWVHLKEYRDYLRYEIHNDWSDALCEGICLDLEGYPEYEERYYDEEV